MKGLAKDLARLTARERVRTEPEDLFAYASDATKHLAGGSPEAVVLPETTDEVSGLPGLVSGVHSQRVGLTAKPFSCQPLCQDVLLRDSSVLCCIVLSQSGLLLAKPRSNHAGGCPSNPQK